MTLEEHNKSWKVNRQLHDLVLCHTLGYGEISQYDPLCSSCWLGADHNWARHDRQILERRRQDAEHAAYLAAREDSR